MKTYHQLFALVLVILTVLAAIFFIRVTLTIINDDVTSIPPSENIHTNKNLFSQSFAEYLLGKPLLNF